MEFSSSEDEDNQTSFRCPHCSVPFLSSRARNAHKGRCKDRYNFTTNDDDDDDNVDFGGGSDDFGAVGADRSHRETVCQVRTSSREAATRRAPQDEGIGYDMFATFRRGELSELASRVLRQERQRSIQFEQAERDDLVDVDEVDDYGGILAEDLSLSDNDSDYSVSSNDQDLIEDDADSVDLSASMQNFKDEWEDCKDVNDVSHLPVHKIPQPVRLNLTIFRSNQPVEKKSQMLRKAEKTMTILKKRI